MDAFGRLDVRWVNGFTSKNVEFVDKDTICYTSGTHLCFLNLQTKIQSVFPCPGRGIGAFTASGNNGVIAFSEQRLKPSIFVYVFPELKLKHEIKGTAQLDHSCLALSDGGPYLACCSTLPDHTITVGNWETGDIICAQPKAGKDAISLVFNPMNCLQMCALGTATLTVWNIEKSASFHLMKASVVELPATDGSIVEKEEPRSFVNNDGVLYLGPEMPSLPLSWLKSGQVYSMKKPIPRLTPTAICWTATSKLYVGCDEGFLLLVDPESLAVSVLSNPTDAGSVPELTQGSLEGLAFNGNNLIAAGKGRAHCLQAKAAQIEVLQTWEFKGRIKSLTFSLDYETLVLSSDLGQICMVNPPQSGRMEKLLDINSGSFVAAAFLCTEKNICVSVRDSGVLQLWSEDGICLGLLPLQVEVTTLACCPVAQCAAVGTKSGHVLFIDLSNVPHPRLVHKSHLYRSPVEHLVFDQEGHYLLTAASDLHVYVLHAKPSTAFSVIGFTALCMRESQQVKVLTLCSENSEQEEEGSLLTLLTLPVKDLPGPECVDRHGRLSDQILKESWYKVPDPLTSCVLGVDEMFAYCHRRKTLQRFQMPQDPGHQQVIQLKPEKEVKGHPLGPASLFLSPHHAWLASVGRDGLLLVRETTALEVCTQRQCHAWRLGGVRGVSFSTDGHTLLSTGVGDQSLVCCNIRIKDLGAGDRASEHGRDVAAFLEDTIKAENSFLGQLPELHPSFPTAAGKGVGVAEQDLSPTATELTWQESRHAAVVKEDNERYHDVKEDMRKTIKELREALQEMIRENENVPEIERLEDHEFILDVEEHKRQTAMVEEEVANRREELKKEIEAKGQACKELRRECWDSMKVRGRAIKAFLSEDQVTNYPMKERTEEELEDLRRVQNSRKIEMAACDNESLRRTFKAAGSEERGGEDREEGSQRAALTGSISSELGFSDPYLYDQFELYTAEQKINQITLLQDMIHRIKMAFNSDFDTVYKQKLQELNRLKDRNKRISEIAQELGVDEPLWEPSLTNGECPERALTVDDSEVKAEKFLTPEQKEEEERKMLEEQRRLAAKGEEFREIALVDMMDGVLEVKKEDILKMEIPAPDFVANKPDSQWSEEERKAFREYENKVADLSAEQTKYAKVLESEMKKLQESNNESAERFDKALTKLARKKMRFEMAVHQEELKIASLVYSVHVEEQIRRREDALRLELEKKLAFKEESRETLQRYKDEEVMCREAYDAAMAEDKLLDKDFRKEFFDVPNPVVDHLYKLYKRRPRVQKLRTQADAHLNPFKEPRLCGSMAPDSFGKMLRAMEELDAPENMPEALNPAVWEKFCLVRKTKVESEQQVKLKALNLAETQAFVQRRINEDEALAKEIKDRTEELENLHKEKHRFLSDVMVQLLLKQGQVEVEPAELAPDYSDCVLVHRSVVEDLNTTIRMHGEQKLATMVERKDFRKGIIQQEWENKRLRMKIEDLNTKARDLQMLRLTEEQREYLKETDQGSHASRKMASLERTMAFQEKMHHKRILKFRKRISQLNRQAALKLEKNAEVEQQLAELEVAVAEKRHIYDAIAAEDDQAAQTDERYREIVQTKKLQDLARTQAEELTVLRAEVERLRRRNFPSLDQLTHTNK